MKNNTGILIILACIILGAGVYLNQRTSQTGFQIAIVQPASHPAMDEIFTGFKERIQAADIPVRLIRFNADNNKTLMRAQLEEIASKKYAGVMTIGSSATQLMHEVNKKTGAHIPHVFTAVENLDTLGIPTNTHIITGATTVSNYQKQLELLKKLVPETKKIVLAYDPSKNPHLESHAQHIPELAQQLGMHVSTYQIYHPNEIIPTLEQPIQLADVVLILTDHTLVGGIDALVKLCNKYNVLLYASDLNSAQKGAALAFGVTEKEYGTTAGESMITLLQEKTMPPIKKISLEHLVLNKAAFEKQGGHITPTLTKIVRQEGGKTI